MPEPFVMPKHTDENVYDGKTGQWSRRPRTANDNVSHGGGYWNTQGDMGIVNAGLVEVFLRVFLTLERDKVPTPEKKGIGKHSIVKSKDK